MTYFLAYILTFFVSFIGNYIGAFLALSFPLSEANIFWILKYVLLFSLLIYIPILIVFLKIKKRRCLWLIAIEFVGFLASAYFQFILVDTIASV